MSFDPKELANRIDPKVIRVEIPGDEEEQKRAYNKILNDMVLAFYKQSDGLDTEEKTRDHCKNILEICISGFKSDNEIWHRAPGRISDDWFDILRKRLRVYKYDIDKKQRFGLRTKKIKNAAQSLVEREKNKRSLKLSKQAEDNDTADEEDFSLSIKEKMRMEEFKEMFMKNFPLNATVIDELMMHRLAFMSVLNERDYNAVEVTKNLTKEIIELAESLGVSGKQRVKQSDEDRSGSLEQLFDIYKESKKEAIDADREWMIEELKLISNAIHRGSLEEFLGMAWIRREYMEDFNGKKLTLSNLDNFLMEMGVSFANI